MKGKSIVITFLSIFYLLVFPVNFTLVTGPEVYFAHYGYMIYGGLWLIPLWYLYSNKKISYRNIFLLFILNVMVYIGYLYFLYNFLDKYS